jgi:hypothetical protein
MKPAIIISLIAACAAFCDAQGTSRHVRGLASPTGPATIPPTLPRSGVWACVPVVVWNATWLDHDGDGQVSAGDCLAYPPQAQTMIDFRGTTTTSVGRMPGLTSLASFLLNETCGGYTVLETLGADQLAGADTDAKTDPVDLPPADLTCPENAIAARVSAATDSAESGGGGRSEPSVVTTTPKGRGVGVPVSACRNGYEKSGLLCYPTCRDGYYSSVTMCVPRCPSGWDNQGLVCAAHSYAPGSMARPWGGCPDRKPHNCAGVCYEECRDGYVMSSTGCGFCRTDGSCPTHTTNVAGVCWKSTYDRGAGVPMSCASGLEYDTGLCYKACPSGASGVGPLCYASCPASYYRLGLQCYKSKATRDGILSAIVIGTVLAAVTLGVAAAYAAGPTAALLAAEGAVSLDGGTVAVDAAFAASLNLAPAGPILTTLTEWDTLATMTPIFGDYYGVAGATMLQGSGAIASGNAWLAWGIGVLTVVEV